MDKIDKFWADRCGVEITLYADVEIGWVYEGKFYNYLWTIKDPRCREVCREKEGISTISNHAQSTANYDTFYWAETLKHTGRGKTIAEAEMNCLQAIYKENNDE